MSLKCLISSIMPIFIFKPYRSVVTTMGIYMKGMEVWGWDVCVCMHEYRLAQGLYRPYI